MFYGLCSILEEFIPEIIMKSKPQLSSGKSAVLSENSLMLMS